MPSEYIKIDDRPKVPAWRKILDRMEKQESDDFSFADLLALRRELQREGMWDESISLVAVHDGGRTALYEALGVKR